MEDCADQIHLQCILFGQIANGRPRQGTPAVHLLIGAAVAFANQLREWRRFISGAGKARVPFGM